MKKPLQNHENQILKVAAYAGKIVLTSGAETYRVEQTVTKVGKHFGLDVECFATLTCLISSGTNSDGEIVSLVERITSRNTNLDKIHQLHNVIKNLQDYNLESLHQKLKEIDKENSYPFLINFLASSLGAGSFVVSFGGGASEFLAASVTGASISLFSFFSKKLEINSFFINVICGALCSLIPYGISQTKLLSNPSISTISALMLLVPGVAFINSIRDIIAGDLVSGTSRATEVLITGLALAVGAGLVIKLFYVYGGA